MTLALLPLLYLYNTTLTKIFEENSHNYSRKYNVEENGNQRFFCGGKRYMVFGGKWNRS